MRPIPLLVLLALGPAAAQAASIPSFEQAIAMPARELIPALKATAFADRDEDSLLELLSDNDAGVRAQAARSLKTYVVSSEKTQDALLGLMNDTWQPESVRREAVKTLSLATQNDRVREPLLSLARDTSQSASLRALACKALWWAAGFDGDTQDALRGLLADDSENEAVRAGAAWALFNDLQDGQTVDALRQRAADTSLSTPAPVRYEAVRSLYLAMGNSEVASTVRDIANDGWAPLGLRQAAVLAHQAINNDDGVKQWLQGLAADQSQPQLRGAAVEAMRVGPDLELTRFFHLARFGRQPLDPLQDE